MPLSGWENWPEELSALAPWGPYRVKVTRWYDGDTFYAIDNYGKRRMAEEPYRLRGIDTPELNSKYPAERLAAQAARDYAISILPVGSFCVCATYKDTQSFNRYIADVYFARDGAIHDLVALLLQEQQLTHNWGWDAAQAGAMPQEGERPG